MLYFFALIFRLKQICVNGMASFGAVVHSIISGVFAASAGVAGKLAFDEALVTNSCLQLRSIYKSSELLIGWVDSIEFFEHNEDSIRFKCQINSNVVNKNINL